MRGRRVRGRLALTIWAALLALPASSSKGVATETLTTCAGVQALATGGGADGIRASLRGTVVYSDPGWSRVFVTDPTGTVLVVPGGPSPMPEVGHLVAIEGTTLTSPGEAFVTDATIIDLGSTPLPPLPLPSPGSGGLRLDWIDRWSSLSGIVRRVEGRENRLFLHIVAQGQQRRVVVVIPERPHPSDERFLGAAVSVRGVLAAVTSPAQAVLGGLPLWCPSRQEVTVERVAVPRDLVPLVTIADAIRDATGSPEHRLRIRGVLTQRLTVSTSLLRDGSGEIRFRHPSPVLKPGDDVDVVGFLTSTPEGPEFVDVDTWVRGTTLTTPLRAEESAPITTVAALRALPRHDAERGLPVRLEAVLTWRHPLHGGECFIQQGKDACYVIPKVGSLALAPGDLVRVEGLTNPGSLAPIISGAVLTRLRHAGLPAAPEVLPDIRLAGRFDCQPGTIRGIVRGIRKQEDNNLSVLTLHSSGRRFPVLLPPADRASIEALLDTRVSARGIVGTSFDWAGKLSGFRFYVSRLEDVTVLEHPVPDPFELPVTGTAELFRTGNPQTWGHRLHVRGTVLLQRPGIVFLRDDDGSVVLRSPLLLPTRPGDILDAVGFPVPDAFAPGLDDASFRIYSHGAPPTPVDAAPAEILSGRLNANLVRVEGLVLDVVRTHARLTVLLEAQNSILSAVLDSDAPGPLVEGLEVGSRVRIAGVVGPTAAERLILRSSADLNLLATPPFWNPSRARSALAIFALLVCAAFLWALTLRKRVQAQTKTIGERLLERNGLIAELETRNAELERFTYTVSHDLKTPLVTIGGFLGLVEQDALAGNPQRLRADLKRISEATDKMRRLLDELLQLSRAGRRLNTVEALPLRPIVDEALSIVDARSSRVRVDVHSPLPTVLGDRGRLIEVFQNLLENAFKYAGNQEAPTVEIGCDGFDEKGDAKIFVRDNGIGIPPQFHSRIFELFEKLDPLSQGTGVGLALVRRIVDAHGGSVSVSSLGDGTGTTFTLTLPVASPARRT